MIFRRYIPRMILFVILCPAFLVYPNSRSNSKAESADDHKLTYQVVIQGDIEDELRRILKRISETVELAERPPLSRGQLTERVEKDTRDFRQALRSAGYYAGRVRVDIEYEKTPLEIVFEIETGDPFQIAEVIFEDQRESPDKKAELPEPESFGLAPGQPIKTAAVKEAKEQINDWLQNRGYPFPRTEIKDIIIDHATREATVHFAFNPGPKGDFGELDISGLERLEPEYVIRRIPWERGERFEKNLLQRLQRNLMETALFAMVNVETEDRLTPRGQLPVLIDLRERKPRTIKSGGGYNTDIGPEFSLGWSHRNLKGKGDKLELGLNLSDQDSSLNAGYQIPDFSGDIRQTLRLNTGLSLENTDAYRSRGWFTSARLERRLTPDVLIGGGIGYRLARLDEQIGRRNLGLLSFPFNIVWDTRDQILDPSKGFRINQQLVPFIDTLGGGAVFVKTYTSASGYLELWPENRIILAARGGFGTISAESRGKVPPDERFYAGGGGSIRGYSFQSVGPRDEDTPTGGLSKLEVGAELRFRAGRRSGAVLFLDGGQVYEKSPPGFEQSLLWGWGLGYRYFSDFGPLRIDLAFPLDYRSGIDDRFQVYLSFGQAF